MTSVMARKATVHIIGFDHGVGKTFHAPLPHGGNQPPPIAERPPSFFASPDMGVKKQGLASHPARRVRRDSTDYEN